MRFVFDVDEPRPPVHRGPGGGPFSDNAVSYLYRDYAGLRQLMLDRLAVTLPEWSEQHEPDIWITLVELLAYIGDDLSYYQDAVATEAYLQTARNRISVRRHGRFVGYRLHEGCSARGWVCIRVSTPVSLPLTDIRFAAAGVLSDDGPPVLNADTLPPDVLASFPQYSPVSVQPGAQGPPAVAELLPAHNTIDFWSWGEDDSHLAAGATSAVLVDGQDSRAAPKVTKRPPQRTLQLHAGDVLVLEQTKDPDTGGVGPADPALRQAVRLTGTQLLTDPLFDQPLLEVQWAAEDALRFDLAVTAAGHLCGQASGNVVLVANGVAAADPLDPSAPALSRPGLSYATPFPDPRTVGRHQARRLHSIYHRWREQIAHWRTQADHGTPLSTEHLEMLALQVGDDALERLGLGATRRGLRKDIRAELDADALTELLARADRLLAGRRRRLDYLARVAAGTGPLDAVLIDELQQDWGTELTAALAPGQPGSWGPAATAISQDPRAALPILQLTDGAGNSRRPVLDLIGAAPTDRVFVAEVNDEGIAQLRINNPPAAAGSLSGAYWVGNGAAGNVETEAINALVWVPGEQAGSVKPPALSGISVIRNPLAVVGGIEAENVAAAKLAIPGCFAVGQQRALTADDYAALAAALPGVRRGAAELRFTGSTVVVDVAVQPDLGEDPSDELLAEVRRSLAAVRRIGQQVRVLAPHYRPVAVELEVGLGRGAIRRDVAHHLARLLSGGWLHDGTPALFNPAKMGFAAPVYSSPILAAVGAVAGVDSVTLTRFGFLDQPAASGSATPASPLQLGALQIARLDNDPTRPEHGYALVSLEGGR
ncbi:putative baseplate assembly protein [Mycobacterium kiyosense]